MKTNLNLPDHTPAPETLAFAHELAALEATQTAQTRRELLAEVTRLESENASLREQVDALTRARDAAVLQLRGLKQITDETYNAIWEIAGDGKGEWDYPAQITRYVGYLKDEREAARGLCARAATRFNLMIANRQSYPSRLGVLIGELERFAEGDSHE